MEQINNRKYAVTANDLFKIGMEVERILESIKEKDYGFYRMDDMELISLIALKTVEGMNDWQWKNNKGIVLENDIHIVMEIYDMHAMQERMDKAFENPIF